MTEKYIPKVGETCEVLNTDLHAYAWEKCTLLFVGKFTSIYSSKSSKERVADNNYIEFRTAKTKTDVKAKNQISKLNTIVIKWQLSSEANGNIGKILYDAGFHDGPKVGDEVDYSNFRLDLPKAVRNWLIDNYSIYPREVNDYDR
jgi:hypothetical protein